MNTKCVNNAKTVPLNVHRAAKAVQEAIKPFVKEGNNFLAFDRTKLESGNVKSVFEAIQNLHGSVNGQASEEEHEFLKTLLESLDKKENLQPEKVQQLFNIADRVANLTPVDETGQGYLFDTGEEVKKDSKPDENDPFSSLTENLKKILERELKNKASCFGMFAEIAGKFGFNGIKELQEKIDKDLFTDDFKDALSNCLKGEDVNVEGLSDLQKKVFPAFKWGLWAVDKLPPFALKYAPMLGTITTWSLPILTHIPFLGKKVATVFPIIKEVTDFLGKFQSETENIRTAIKEIKGEKPETI